MVQQQFSEYIETSNYLCILFCHTLCLYISSTVLYRKRVCPLSDSREDDDSFLDNLPSIKKSR